MSRQQLERKFGGSIMRCGATGQLPRVRVAFTVTLVGLALIVSNAQAAFTRSFVTQIARAEANDTLSCAAELVHASTCLQPSALGLDGSDDLLVGNGRSSISNFELVDLFAGDAALGASATLFSTIAWDQTTKELFVSGVDTKNDSERHVEVFASNDSFVEVWKPEFDGVTHIAVDNSSNPSDPSRGSIYLSHTQSDPSAPGGDELEKGFARLTTNGSPDEFGFAQKCIAEKCSYISGDTITGTPTHKFEFRTPQGLAVDGSGNIYVSGGEESEVDEYQPSGEFIRAITGEETPGLAGDHGHSGFGGEVDDVAIDPVSGHVLVAVDHEKKLGAVDEFEANGRYLNQMQNVEVESTPGVHSPEQLSSATALAVNEQGDVYVADGSQGVVDVFGPGHFLPGFRLAEPSKVRPASATLKGLIDDEGIKLSDCHFEYVTQSAFESTGFTNLASGGEAPCVDPAAAEVPVDKIFHEVHAEVTGLESGVTYRYRISGTTATSELGGVAQSESTAFTAVHAPSVDSTSVSDVTSNFAELHAQIDPLGADTRYRFEYSEDGSIWHDTPTALVDIGRGLPNGSTGASVSGVIGPLHPGTEYRYRVLAENEVGSVFGAVCLEAFRSECLFSTAAAVVPGLPDERSYELVTPPNKGSASDMFINSDGGNSNTGYAATDGNSFLLTASVSTLGESPASEHNAYLFRRSNEGWQTTALAPAGVGVQSVPTEVFDPVDFSEVGINDFVGSDSSVEGAALTTLVGSPGGNYSRIHSDPPVHGAVTSESEASGETEIVGASTNLDRVVLESKDHGLAAGAQSQDPGSEALYLWSAGAGECAVGSGNCSLINVGKNGASISQCGAVLGQSHVAGNRYGAVSADGSSVVFTAPDPYAKGDGAGCWDGGVVNPPQLYIRREENTVEVSKPEKGVTDPSGRHPAIYVGASEDGSKVFFVTQEELTHDSLGIHDLELYEYDTEAGTLSRISTGEPGSPAHEPGSTGADVITVPAISANGEAVYFTAKGRLTSDAPSVSGTEVDLYRYDMSSQTTAFIATIEERDYPSEALDGWSGSEIALDSRNDWYSTPNGRYLMFATAKEIPSVGYDTHEAEAGDCPSRAGALPNGGRCNEIYRYDAESGSLACVSCSPSGEAPTANAEFALDAAGIGPTASPVRAMSDDGAYVFFDTAAALVPQDGNGAVDVYEWHDGVLSLISSGEDPAPSFFLGMSADGKNVFFGTHARLVQEDSDSAGDIYDARVCEPNAGNPCIQSLKGEIGECEGDACQNPPPPPTDATPASITFIGPGGVSSGVSRKTSAAVAKAHVGAAKRAAALRGCRRKRSRRRREACEASVLKRYKTTRGAK